MDRKRALSWAGKYFLVTSAFALVGIVLVVAGLYVANLYAIPNATYFGLPYPTGRSFLGIIPLLLGIAIWRGGKAWAMYITLTGAIEEDLEDSFDTEHVKSDIVAVLDDRLADMQHDLQSVNREIRKLKESDEFEFPGNE